MKNQTNLVILAGGASSRMKKKTIATSKLNQEEIKQANERSKGLIGVGINGRPMMDYVLYNAKKAGYRNVIIVTGEKASLFKEYYGKKDKNNNFQGLNISFATQFIPKQREKPFGTADALFQAVEQFPELQNTSFSVCNSDNLYSIAALEALLENSTPNALIAYDRDAMLFPSERISRFALAKFSDSGHLLKIIEKPSEENIESYRDIEGKLRVSMNAFKFDGKMIYGYLKNCPIHPERNEKELPTALLNMLVDFPLSVVGIPASEHVPDLTAKEDILDVKQYLTEHYSNLDWDN